MLSRIEWPTIALTALCYGGWMTLLYMPIYMPVPLVPLLLMLMLCIALHSSLMHEMLHGHPTRNALVNEALVFLPLGLVWPYRRFRALHLKHHDNELLTDPFEDPESYYLAETNLDKMPSWSRIILRINNTLIGRMILGPLIGTFLLIYADGRRILRGEDKVLGAWLRHLLGLAPVLLLVFYSELSFALYLVAAWGGAALISIRTYAEHRWHETPDGRTIIVEKSPLSWLFLNNNLHIVHHIHPGAAWYELPRLYREDRAGWQRRNQGYVYRGYWELFRDYAVRSKEPVVHPAWYRAQEQAQQQDCIESSQRR